MDNKVVYTGPSTMTILGIIFVVLKLVGVIDWSWWWVLFPFYGQIVLVLLIIVLVAICAALFH